MKKFISILCVIAVMLSLCACGAQKPAETAYNPGESPMPEQTDATTSAETTVTEDNKEVVSNKDEGNKEPETEIVVGEDNSDKIQADKNLINMATSVDDIKAAVEQMYENQGRRYRGYEYGYTDGIATTGAMAMNEEASDAKVEMSGMGASDSASPDYSGTNVQVEGIDEADIVKTDGKYIYIIRNGSLIITNTNGAGTKVLSSVELEEDSYTDEDNNNGYRYSSKGKYPQEMYIYGNTVVVITSNYSYEYGKVKDKYFDNEENYTTLEIYDVSNKNSPKFVASLGQDGDYTSSRMKDGKLYLISNLYNYSYWEDGDDVVIPMLYENGSREQIAINKICISPFMESENYLIIGEYNLDTQESEEVISILGGGNEVYMSHNNVYVLNSTYYDNESEPRTERIYTVVDHTYETITVIYRFSIENGLTLETSSKVPGMIDDQFSVDEYNDTLRVVTTYDSYKYTTYTDEEMGFINYKYPEDETSSTSGLYVFDMDLNELGHINNLAEGEYIYSARFDGDIAYFCTFRTVDPLFTVDLSDPTTPVVKSELKISGFSDYLHPWTDGLLFGAGYEANESTGRTQGMKLVMFDTTDKENVFVAKYLNTDINGSSALYNHHAFLIDYDKNIIAFPGYNKSYEDCYFIYSYTPEAGFKLMAEIEADDWSWDTRGLYVGNMIYIVFDEYMMVIDMNTMENIGAIDLFSTNINEDKVPTTY